MRVASFHLAWFPLRQSLSRLLIVPAERWELNQQPGCLLGKVLGTSKADRTRLSVEIRRWAMFAVWEDEAAYRAFVNDSTLFQRWSTAARRSEHWLLQPLAARGSWSGAEPLPGLSPPELVEGTADEARTATPGTGAGSIAVLTRATVSWRRLWTFHRAVPPVDNALTAHAGCGFALGMGELPIGQQGTFSTWESADALRAFAYDGDAHSDVIRRTYAEGWYTEELFARFLVREHHESEPVRLQQA